MAVVSIVLAIVLFIGLPFLAWYYKMFKYRHINTIPGPKPLPIVGNMLEYGTTIVDFLHNMVRLTREYGPLVRMWQGPFRLSLLVTDPSQVEYFLSSNVHITKSSGYNLYKEWLGNGLLVSTGDKWRKHRKIITPTFHFKILEQFTDIYFSCGRILIKKLQSVPNRDSVDIFPFINVYALDVICETAMGIKINAQEVEDIPYVHSVKGWLEIYMKRFFSLFRRNQFFFSLTEDYKLSQKYLKELKAFTTKVIQKRKEEKKTVTSSEESDEFGVKKRVAFLDLLLDVSEDGGVLSDVDIREEVDTFMFEGHDTVTSTMSFALFEIAKHQDVQKNIYEEMVAIMGEDKDSNIALKHLQEMTYLDRVVKEVLRIYPSAPFIEREIEEDIELDGIQIPSGTTISFLPYAMHHNEKLFPEPGKFDPDRYLPENAKGRHPFAYIPFSAGPRNCIGHRYAMNTVKATIAYVLRQFELHPVVPEHKLIIGNDAVLKSINGFPIKLKERN